MSEPKKHFLVKHAEEDPLGGSLDPLEHKIAFMLIGAMRGEAKPVVGRPKASVFVALVQAGDEAFTIVNQRRAAEIRATVAAGVPS